MVGRSGSNDDGGQLGGVAIPNSSPTKRDKKTRNRKSAGTAIAIEQQQQQGGSLSSNKRPLVLYR